jgi:hypothetical protein
MAGCVQLTMTGSIRLGVHWRPFTAVQIVAPGSGYIWAARTRMLGVPIVGFDRYGAGTGQMLWRALSVVPVNSTVGGDVTRSAAGRLASEIAIVPTAYDVARWRAGAGTDTAIGDIEVDGHHHAVTIDVDHSGAVRSAHIQRWGNPDGAAFGLHPFGVNVSAEATFGGITIPTQISAGWFWGTERQADGEFFRARITGMTPSAASLD